jgi:amidohydrolase
MLLGAAALLQRCKKQIQGTVKLVFQPDEEGLTGAQAMLDAGVLEDPAPQAALALHVHSGTPSGLVLCGNGTFMAGCMRFRITVKGVGCHGAMPETGVDPINIAAHVYLSLQELISREVSGKTALVVTVGKFSAGDGANAIPEEAILEGSIRAFDPEIARWAFSRIDEIATCTARAFRGSAQTQLLSQTLPLINDPQLMDWALGQLRELFGEQTVHPIPEGGMGSEDFAAFTHRLPSVYLLLGAGSKEEGAQYGLPMHNEKVVFQESILPKGAAIHAWCALQWLENYNKNTARL